jgi:hypothetical protein
MENLDEIATGPHQRFSHRLGGTAWACVFKLNAQTCTHEVIHYTIAPAL